ncbi:MAG: hypothetical protein ABIF10_08085 [Candidatus Woesearchaeota archaeon]
MAVAEQVYNWSVKLLNHIASDGIKAKQVVIAYSPKDLNGTSLPVSNEKEFIDYMQRFAGTKGLYHLYGRNGRIQPMPATEIDGAISLEEIVQHKDVLLLTRLPGPGNERARMMKLEYGVPGQSVSV